MRPELYPIPGYPDYFVTHDGDVYSARGRTLPRKLKPYPTKAGYLLVSLSTATGKHRTTVHQLVLRTFCGNRPSPNHEARHLDGDPQNNRSANLAWGTRQENMADQARHGTMPIGSRNASAKLDESTIIEIRRLYATGRITQRRLAQLFEVAQSTIGRIVRGDNWTHVGWAGNRLTFAGQPERISRGEHHTSKLTENDVREIRSAHAAGMSMRALGRRLGVSHRTIASIVHREAWRHVD